MTQGICESATEVVTWATPRAAHRGIPSQQRRPRTSVSADAPRSGDDPEWRYYFGAWHSELPMTA